MTKKSLWVSEGDRWYGFHLAWCKEFPSLYEFLGGSDGFTEYRIYCRGDSDFLAVLKGAAPDGAPRIAFASGIDFFGCLVASEVVLEGQRWRPDQPQVRKKG